MEHADPTSKHDNGQKTCPKHVEIYSQNKFEKLVHLICFIIRIFLQTLHISVGYTGVCSVMLENVFMPWPCVHLLLVDNMLRLQCSFIFHRKLLVAFCFCDPPPLFCQTQKQPVNLALKILFDCFCYSFPAFVTMCFLQ